MKKKIKKIIDKSFLLFESVAISAAVLTVAAKRIYRDHRATKRDRKKKR